MWVQSRKEPLEKEVTTHTNVLVWRIPWTEESGRLRSMGSQRFRRDWACNTSSPFSSSQFPSGWAFTDSLAVPMLWNKKTSPKSTPVLRRLWLPPRVLFSLWRLRGDLSLWCCAGLEEGYVELLLTLIRWSALILRGVEGASASLGSSQWCLVLESLLVVLVTGAKSEVNYVFIW